MPSPKLGQRFRLLGDFANQGFHPIGGVRHGLVAGAIGTVVDLVPAETPGAHNDQQDCAVLEFNDESRTVGSDGQLVIVAVSRRVSFAVENFDAKKPEHLFELAR